MPMWNMKALPIVVHEVKLGKVKVFVHADADDGPQDICPHELKAISIMSKCIK